LARRPPPTPVEHATGIRGVVSRQGEYLVNIGAILGVHGVARFIGHYFHLEDQLWVQVLEAGSAWFAVVQFFTFEGLEFIGAVRGRWRKLREQ
jgi:hypothetical protein